MKVLQWARENGCPWNDATCAVAANGGHLEILQWACANGCPWDEWTCNCAVLEGHTEVLRWALANGCPWNHMSSMSYNKVEILQLAYEYHVPYESNTSTIDAECVAFMKGEYGEAWKKRDFGLPHYWNLHIQGANE